MKNLSFNGRSVVKLMVAPLLVGIVATPALAQDDFCWRTSYGRGVGTIPTEVESGRAKIGVLSYSQCPSGTKRVGVDCHSVCPEGMRDDGLFCRATEYGRGAGYVSRAICGRNAGKFGSSDCEKKGALFYPKCRDGYSAFGTNICRPNKPNCNALGLNNGIDLSCAKKVTIGDPRLLVCGSGKERDAGLCYSSCRSSFSGVGPVCWGQCPPGYVNCGAGCASSKEVCAQVTSDQVLSTISLASNIATLGSSGAASATAQSAEEASRVSKMVTEAKVSWAALKKTNAYRSYENVSEFKEFKDNMDQLSNASSTEEALRALANFDPTGVSQVVSAYGRKICGQ